MKTKKWLFFTLAASACMVASISGCVAPKTAPVVIDPVKLEVERQRQRLIAFQQWQAKQIRLAMVSYPLLIAGADLCGKKVRPALGLFVWNTATIPPGLRTSDERYQVSALPQIYAIAPSTPAAKAGLQVGDRILRLGKQRMLGGEPGMRVLQQAAQGEARVGQALPIRVRRGKDDDELELAILPVWRCNFNPRLIRSQAINATADGVNVTVYEGMIDFAKTDQHLAFIIAHEISHNALGHIEAAKTNQQAGALVGLIFDVAGAAVGVNTGGVFSDAGAKAGRIAFSVEFEQEADYVGLHILARVGYPLDGTADFLRTLGAKSPDSIELRTTHPTTPERFLAIEQHVTEIRQMVASGAPLIPKGLEKAKSSVAEQQIAIAPESLGRSTSGSRQTNQLAIAPVSSRQKLPIKKRTKRWVGRQNSDACGHPWAVELKRVGGKVEGTFWRGGIKYDVAGFLDSDRNMNEVRAGKNKLYRNYAGPRLIVFDVKFGPNEARGHHYYDDGKCVTPIRLVPAEN